jgi:hypothetical protein
VSLVQQLQQTAKNYRSCMAEIAYFGWRLRYSMGGSAGNTGNLWPTIGFEGEEQFRESLGIPQSTWYKWLSVGQILCNLSLAELQQIKPTNASLLTQVDPSLVADYPWVREAKTLSSDEFALLISQRNKQKGITKEPTLYFKVKVPATAKKFLEETVERFRVEHELASSAEALEMLIADVHDRPNAMNSMKHAAELVNKAMAVLQSDGRTYQWLYRARDLLTKTYSAVRMETPDEENEEALLRAEEERRIKNRPTGEGIVSTKPYGSDGPSRPGRPAVEEPSGYLHPLLAPDEFGGDDDDLEDGGQG